MGTTLNTLWKRGTDFLGCEHAIMGGAMSWVSERNLVAALSNAGAFGVIACSSMSPELLDKEIKATRELLKTRDQDSGFRIQGSGKLETERCVLRPFTMDDKDQYYALVSNPETMKTIGGGVRSREDADKEVDKLIQHFDIHGYSILAIYDKNNGAFIGKAGFTKFILDPEQPPQLSLHYILAPEFWGNGYGKEIACMLVSYAFNELKVDKIVVGSVPNNTASTRIIEQNGFEYKKDIVFKGLTTAYYELKSPNPESRPLTPPFGVNLIIMHPQMPELIQTCINNNVTHVVLAGGIPRQEMITPLKDAGIKVIGFAPAAVIAKKLIKMGADALVIEGMEAGGHIGPVSTSVLAQEILPEVTDVPVFVAGGIGRGEAMAGYLEMGASGVQLGTRFVCATESIAHENFKKAFIKGNARDAQPSVQIDPDFPVIPVRALVNHATEEFTRKQIEVIAKFRAGALEKTAAQLEIEHFWAGALRKAVIDGDIERGSVMAGQSVGMVKSIQPVAEILAELNAQAERYLQKGLEACA